MPLWPAPDTDTLEQRVRKAHASHVGTEATHVAQAPATWSLVGEHIDHFGGVTVMGLADMRAAAAVSPRTDGVISVTQIQITEPGKTATEQAEVTLAKLSELSAAQQPVLESNGRTTHPEPPTGGLAERIGGVIFTQISRQQLSRETAGADVTIVSDIPARTGLGAETAADVAVALAMLGDAEDTTDAPLRARLAEICTQAVDTFSELPALRARHTAALRGVGETVSIIDYADGSVTQAPHPVGAELAAFILTVPGKEQEGREVLEIRRRQRFNDAACHAFGAESLRLLPDAPQRVIEWLGAVHEVHGAENQPTLAEASSWLNFYDEETSRAQEFARALRSRRTPDLYPLINQSQSALTNMYALDASQQLAELAALRGAVATRSASAGTTGAVIAYVPAKSAANFAADLGEDGLNVIALTPGAVAN